MKQECRSRFSGCALLSIVLRPARVRFGRDRALVRMQQHLVSLFATVTYRLTSIEFRTVDHSASTSNADVWTYGIEAARITDQIARAACRSARRSRSRPPSERHIAAAQVEGETTSLASCCPHGFALLSNPSATGALPVDEAPPRRRQLDY